VAPRSISFVLLFCSRLGNRIKDEAFFDLISLLVQLNIYTRTERTEIPEEGECSPLSPDFTFVKGYQKIRG
jgi:hypothetical protein